jgi:hypothetical protein
MSDLNHLFTGFSKLFDPKATAEVKALAKASIQRNVENNLELINRIAKEKGSTSQVTIHL